MNQLYYDVVICGGGLAGQTLARQLKLTQPHLSILILEKARFPRPLATLKVGESLIESSAFYLSEILQLHAHLDQEHLPKLGLRYFWSDPDGCLSQQPEIGLTHYASFPSYQLDRGKLENYLYTSNREMGVQICDGVTVQAIELGSKDTPHQIRYQTVDKSQESSCATQVQARWVIDAMGRRRYLQKQLGLLIPSNQVHSAAWFRVKGRVDISDLVPATEKAWHDRVPNNLRYYSTNHLMGDGYWIWIIPLSSGYTSIGIVGSKPNHLIADYSTRTRALQWLEMNEPAFCNHLQTFEIVDFLALNDYSFSSKQLFSLDRWACVGDASLFPDPFYSPGVVTLAYENSMVTKLIELDEQGELSAAQVDHYNLFIRSINEYDTILIQKPYDYFDLPHIWSLRHLWALALSWGMVYPQAFNQLYLDPQKSEQVRGVSGHIAQLAFKLEGFFSEWADKTTYCFDFDFINYLSLPFLQELYTRNTQRYDAFEQILANLRFGVARLEEFAQVLFWMAVRDVMPEKLADLPDPLWVEPQAISLDPTRWLQDGLFQPKSAPRDLSVMQAQVAQLYIFDTAEAGTAEADTDETDTDETEAPLFSDAMALFAG